MTDHQRGELRARAIQFLAFGREHPLVMFALMQLSLTFGCGMALAWELVGRMARGDFSFDPEARP